MSEQATPADLPPTTVTLNDLNDLRRQVLAGTLKMTPELSRQIVEAIRRNRGIDVVAGQAMPAKRKGTKAAVSESQLLADLDKSLGI